MPDIKEIMRRQAGPMPVWAWTAFAAAFIAGVIIFRRRMAGSSSAAAPGTGTAGPAGEFSSGQTTTTTDAAGNQISTQYNASGPLTGYPGMLTTQAGVMPYSGGDVYVNYPATNAAPPPPPHHTVNQTTTVLNPAFNSVGWDDKAKQSPWKMTVANNGESWEDITARIYKFADNFSKVTDPAAQKRVKEVAAYLKSKNANWTGTVPDGTGPTPGSVVVWR